jgi:hypothetical protein
MQGSPGVTQSRRSQVEGSYAQGQHWQGPSGEAHHRQGGQGQYGQSQYEQEPYGQRQYGQGQYGQGKYEQGPYGQQRRASPAGAAADYNYGTHDYDSQAPARPEGFEQRAQRARGYGSRGYSSFSQAPFAQQPFGHAPFGHSAFGESNEPHYFGTGVQGYGGGPSFTGGTYGYADQRSDSPYFQEVGFNRGYYEDPLGRESYPQDGSRRESYPRQDYRRQDYPYARAVGTPGAPPQRRRYPMGPKGYKRSDERLREEISERLMQAYDIDSSDVTILVLGGKVLLEGTVPDRYMKHAIEDLADAAPGVEDVDNRIRVVANRSRSEAGPGGMGDTSQSRDSRDTARDTAQPLGTQSTGADAGSLANAGTGPQSAGSQSAGPQSAGSQSTGSQAGGGSQPQTGTGSRSQMGTGTGSQSQTGTGPQMGTGSQTGTGSQASSGSAGSASAGPPAGGASSGSSTASPGNASSASKSTRRDS